MDHSTEFPNFLRTSPPAHVPRETSHVVSLLLLATYRSNMEVVKVGEAGANRRKTVSGQKLLSLETGAKATGADKERMLRYSRGEGNKSKGVTKHRLKLKLKRGEKKISMASKRAAQAEILLPTRCLRGGRPFGSHRGTSNLVLFGPDPRTGRQVERCCCC